MCLPGTMVASWFLTQEVVGLSPFNDKYFYRPQRSWGKVMFLHVSVILFTGGCYPSMHSRWYPSMPCRFLGPHPGGKLRGLTGRWGVSRPTPKGKLRGLVWGGLQAHTLGGVSQHALRQTP